MLVAGLLTSSFYSATFESMDPPCRDTCTKASIVNNSTTKCSDYATDRMIGVYRLFNLLGYSASISTLLCCMLLILYLRQACWREVSSGDDIPQCRSLTTRGGWVLLGLCVVCWFQLALACASGLVGVAIANYMYANSTFVAGVVLVSLCAAIGLLYCICLNFVQSEEIDH